MEGRSVVSCDPLYRFTAREIRDRIEKPYEVVLASAGANREPYVWKDVGRRPGWAGCGCGPCDASSTTSRKDLRKDAIARMVYPRWVSVIPGSTWPYAPVSCSPTPSSHQAIFISTPSRRCAGWRGESSRC
ncbi:MAG TPA: hypothetical protein VNA27_07445 [Rubrobacteraceae bacterium]|nr:hypothetical protein [Rubrobacteraceae bacterium]